MDRFGPFGPEEVHFGPFRSANRALAIPEMSPGMRCEVLAAKETNSGARHGTAGRKVWKLLRMRKHGRCSMDTFGGDMFAGLGCLCEDSQRDPILRCSALRCLFKFSPQES